MQVSNPVAPRRDENARTELPDLKPINRHKAAWENGNPPGSYPWRMLVRIQPPPRTRHDMPANDSGLHDGTILHMEG